MPTFTTSDGVTLFYKDWGSGRPIVFSHGWPLSSDDWDDQMLFFLQHGFRVIAHDRRGHGRSTQTPDGHDIDHYADDPVFDDLQAQLAANRSVFYRTLASGPFYGFNRSEAGPDEGVVANWWRQGMMGDVYYAAAGPKSAALLPNGILKTYKGFPHGMITTQADTVNADILEFLRASS